MSAFDFDLNFFLAHPWCITICYLPNVTHSVIPTTFSIHFSIGIIFWISFNFFIQSILRSRKDLIKILWCLRVHWLSTLIYTCRHRLKRFYLHSWKRNSIQIFSVCLFIKHELVVPLNFDKKINFKVSLAYSKICVCLHSILFPFRWSLWH